MCAVCLEVFHTGPIHAGNIVLLANRPLRKRAFLDLYMFLFLISVLVENKSALIAYVEHMIVMAQ